MGADYDEDATGYAACAYYTTGTVAYALYSIATTASAASYDEEFTEFMKRCAIEDITGQPFFC